MPTRNGLLILLAMILAGDIIASEIRARAAAAEAEQEHYDREFSLIAENYANE